MHARTTAREIVNDFQGEPLDYWVTGFGTGGTLKGVGRVLKKERPETQIVLAEPVDAAMVSSGAEQPRGPDGAPSARHSAWKPHPIQGWSPDFIPKLTGDAVAAGYVDRTIKVQPPEAMHWSKQLARQEGIFVGISAGGSFAAAIEVSKDAPRGSTVLCMLPDTGERYLTTPLFADVPAEMTEDELALLRSSPTYADAFAPAGATI
jgi:cysteine synthase A